MSDRVIAKILCADCGNRVMATITDTDAGARLTSRVRYQSTVDAPYQRDEYDLIVEQMPDVIEGRWNRPRNGVPAVVNIGCHHCHVRGAFARSDLMPLIEEGRQSKRFAVYRLSKSVQSADDDR